MDGMAAEERDIVIVLTNLPDSAAATALAQALIEQRLAACVNVLAECKSIYRWEGEIRNTIEVPLLIKTSCDSYAALEEKIRAHHPYELPEILCIPASGLPAYLEWVRTQSATG
jgi:periplasmic divalent cation tolerance protein